MYARLLLDLHLQLKTKNFSLSIFCLRASLGPKYKYPTQLREAASAYEYLVHTLHIQPSNITVAGDSSGGHLAIQLLRHISQPHPLITRPIARNLSPKAVIFLSPVVRTKNLNTGTFITNLDTDYINMGPIRRWLDKWRSSEDPEELAEFVPNPKGFLPWKTILPEINLILWGANEVWASAIEEFYDESIKVLPLSLEILIR